MPERPKNISVDLCPSCQQVEDAKGWIDVGRCAGCGRYTCDCWLETVSVEGERGNHIGNHTWCAPDVPGGCVKTRQCDACSGSGGECEPCGGEGRVEIQT